MTLTKENYDKLNTNFLYRKDPDLNRPYLGGAYWCRNWTFIVHKTENGKAFMYDTYWGSSSDDYIEVTDENIEDFKFVFDFREVVKIRDERINEYRPEDVICAATDSGGMSCGHKHWILKGTEKSKELCIKKKKDEIKTLKWKLELAEWELNELLEN